MGPGGGTSGVRHDQDGPPKDLQQALDAERATPARSRPSGQKGGRRGPAKGSVGRVLGHEKGKSGVAPSPRQACSGSKGAGLGGKGKGSKGKGRDRGLHWSFALQPVIPRNWGCDWFVRRSPRDQIEWSKLIGPTKKRSADYTKCSWMEAKGFMLTKLLRHGVQSPYHLNGERVHNLRDLDWGGRSEPSVGADRRAAEFLSAGRD